LVKHYQGQYSSACKSDKPLIALQIVLRLKKMSPPGRFLSKPPAARGAGVEADYWIEVDEVQATRKVAQRLREKMASSWEARHRRRQDVATKTGEVVDAVLSQASTFSYETAGLNGASDTTTVLAVTSSRRHIIEPDNEDEVRAGANTEDRDPDSMTSITILWDDDHGVGLGDIPTAAALLDLLEDF
jgi:hypothetical protein